MSKELERQEKLLKALDEIKDSYDAFFIDNKFSERNTHKEQFDLLSKELNLSLKKGALAWIKYEYDCYYKGYYEDESGSAFEYIRNLILKGEQKKSEELTPLQALIMLQPLFVKYPLFQKNYDIIEKALKELEERREMMKRFNEACVPMILDNKTEKKFKALEIIKEKDVDVGWLKIALDLYQYNNGVGIGSYSALTKEEYDLLKEVLL